MGNYVSIYRQEQTFPEAKSNSNITRMENEDTDECVTLYENECFNGKSQKFGVGKHDIVDLIIDKMLNEGVGNDSVSSLKVKKGYRVKLFEHVGFEGKSVTFGAGDYDNNELQKSGFENNTLSSLIVEEDEHDDGDEDTSHVS